MTPHHGGQTAVSQAPGPVSRLDGPLENLDFRGCRKSVPDSKDIGNRREEDAFRPPGRALGVGPAVSFPPFPVRVFFRRTKRVRVPRLEGPGNDQKVSPAIRPRSWLRGRSTGESRPGTPHRNFRNTIFSWEKSDARRDRWALHEGGELLTLG